MRNNPYKDALILCLITLISGFLLCGVYYVTKDPIAKQSEMTLNNAYISVFKDADKFESDDKCETALKEYQSYLTGDYGKNGLVLNDLKIAYADNESIGYVCDITTKDGYGGDIEIIIGIKNDLNVSGIEILSISESPGLGMNAKNEEFLDQYINKNTDVFTVVKNKSNLQDGEIDAISSATITTSAMSNAVNGSLAIVKEVSGVK